MENQSNQLKLENSNRESSNPLFTCPYCGCVSEDERFICKERDNTKIGFKSSWLGNFITNLHSEYYVKICGKCYKKYERFSKIGCVTGLLINIVGFIIVLFNNLDDDGSFQIWSSIVCTFFFVFIPLSLIASLICRIAYKHVRLKEAQENGVLDVEATLHGNYDYSKEIDHTL